MNSIEFKSNADTLKKSTPLSSEDVCSKCTNPSLNTISSFPASTSSTSVPYTKMTHQKILNLATTIQFLKKIV